MHEFVIRQALPTVADAHAVSAVEAVTLGDSDLTPDEILAVIARPEHYVYLGRWGSRDVAMLATFETRSAGALRLELDMLGVLEGYRGRGLARALVTRAIDDGIRRGCTAFRAVVAEDNLASQRVFERCGLGAGSERYTLWSRIFRGYEPVAFLPGGWRLRELDDLADAGAGLTEDWRLPGHRGVLVYDDRGALAAVVALLEVHTIAYSGLWVERIEARDDMSAEIALLAAAEGAKRERVDEIGVLVPSQASTLAAIGSAAFERIGEYRVYIGE